MAARAVRATEFNPQSARAAARLVDGELERVQSDLESTLDGELRIEMEAYAEAAGLQDRTRFLGNVNDTRPLMAASDVTVLASTAVETFSMAMLESMAIGVPMIAPRIGGLSEAIIDNETGLLFPIGDSSALARCMKYVVERPSEVASMGRSSRQKVTAEFTLAKMITGSEHVLRNAMNAIGSLEKSDL